MRFSLLPVRFLIISTLVLTLLAQLPARAAAAPPTDSDAEVEAAQEGPRFVPGEVLIQFRAGATASQHAAARSRVRARTVEQIRPAGRGEGRLELARV
ncbi:MAG: hypothetical protein M3Q29_24240, partial [Chloroflexota bacterium]|nr:hypothetical protein [Chloroflexota bacterium]